ncbi:uncharacterized protein LOC126899873 isoform X5 [Daktulosphaira vitifoliae]|uniref:uncharacterized protein LOC126899873 isoform X5 n=1 Tax=Daktulosphaira vitifoliae TaxID=58002 RepID=UPI0021AA6F57|nr:uncharacterized protein LOC126899873 isoform X5 [Daktulosphaira vitifoliae]
MKSFNIVTFSLILFGGFLLTSCNQTNVVDILNSLLKTEKWTFGEKNTYYNYPNLVSSDLLINDSQNGNIVTEDNVKIKLLEASQLISYEYAITLHWLAYKLISLNYYFSQHFSTADLETRKQYSDTMKSIMTKVKKLTQRFFSALQFIDNLDISYQKLFLKRLSEILLIFNEFDLYESSNELLLSFYQYVLSGTLESSINSVILCINHYYKAIPIMPMSNLDDLHIKYYSQSYTNKKSAEELADLKSHCKLILKSVDEFIEKKYTNLGFIYNENLGESYYNL